MPSEEEKKELKKIKGKIRGAALLTDIKYIKKHKQEKKQKEIFKDLKKDIPDFNAKKIKNTEWYPLWWRVLLLVILKEKFKWSNKALFKMGREAPLNSFIVKILLRYFTSLEKTCRQVNAYWKKHYSRGQMEAGEFNQEKKYVVFRLKNFKIHPLLCTYLRGYFNGLADLTIGSEEVNTEETKCSFEGDPYHEFVIKWK